MSLARTFIAVTSCFVALTLISACSSLSSPEPLRIELVNVTPLPGQALEVLFEISLLVQNPNDRELSFQGVALELDLNDQPLLSGVSNQRGVIPAFSEQVLQVPVRLGAFAMARQFWAAAHHDGNAGLPYRISASLGGSWLGPQRFSDEGTLHWPPTMASMQD